MQRSMLSGQRLVAIFLAGCILFNYPVLSLFDKAAMLFGVPLIFVYLFLVWAGLIALMAVVVDRRPERGGRE